MKNKQRSMGKEYDVYFKMNKVLNDNLPVYTASPCEKKCIRCDVSSKDCKYS